MRICLPEAAEGLFEFSHVQLSVSVVVELLEHLLQSSETESALRLNVHFELEVQLLNFHVTANAVECHLRIIIK